MEDARGTLFYHYTIFLQKLQPKMFLFENVRGLLTHDHGRTYSLMLDIFSQAGYSIQKQTERCHPLEARPFTVRENARCQSFPDDWVFCGSVGQQYKQVGNAVPVNLAYEIALEIREALDLEEMPRGVLKVV